MKVHVICLTLCSLAHGVYISRMSTNRLRSPTPFRPGLMLQRPWPQPQTRLVQAASHRSPYIVYRNPSHRYAVKHYNPSATRNMFAGGAWKTTARLPYAPSSPEYEFVKAASTPPVVHTDGGTGGIHTIPAPNLSLSEKPIVVIDASDTASDQPKPTYEVTEKYQEPELTIAKIEAPIGFSKATSFTTPELQKLIRNGAALQIASEYGIPINMPLPQVAQQSYPLQTFNGLPTQQDLVNTGTEGIFIPPNALYQSDPMFLQKLQNQLLQRFPAVEFIPYSPETAPQIPNVQLQTQASHHPQVIIVNEQMNKQVPEQKNVVQRETQESFVTLLPQTFRVPNTTVEETTPKSQPHNITLDIVSADSQPVTTTIKYVIENNNSEQNTTPIYYAQIGQSVGSVIANGFYSAINDVRAAAAAAQVENPEEVKAATDNITTTTTLIPDVKAYFVQNDEKTVNKTELKSLLGVPFRKPEDSVNVEYTLLRTEEKKPKVTQEGAVYAGQIVEATVSEDQEFNKEKANLISRRAPIRLFAAIDTKDAQTPTVTSPPSKVTVIKAKIPPKTKLTFDDKTGEPILRIYASYVDNAAQKDAIVTKLAQMNKIKETLKTPVENWKTVTVQAADKPESYNANDITQFGLKLRSRSDDYIPLFEEYDD